MFKQKISTVPGIVLFRFDPFSPEETAQLLLDCLKVPDIHFEGRLTVIERDKIRQRILPI